MKLCISQINAPFLCPKMTLHALVNQDHQGLRRQMYIVCLCSLAKCEIIYFLVIFLRFFSLLTFLHILFLNISFRLYLFNWAKKIASDKKTALKNINFWRSY